MRKWLCLLAAAIVSVAPVASHAGDATVFAAASLTDAMQAVGRAYEARTGRHVALSFAASSALAKQIASSRGADIFISADTDWMDFLESKDLIDRASRTDLLGNQLVLIAPAASPVSLAIEPHFDLLRALNGGRLAVADPASVPAGKYARASLAALGVWDEVAGHLAPAENVRLALAYVARGEAPLGIVYTTDAISEPNVKIVGTFPGATHPPIVYPAALTKDATGAAHAFYQFLRSRRARPIFEKYGFTVLGRPE